VVIDVFARAYPELAESRERIAKMCKAEEARFLETLEAGIRRFEEVAARTRSRGEAVISGRDLFTLYDTHGFPPDMTAEMAAEKGLEVDQAGFEAEMEQQVERSRTRFEAEADEDVPWEWTESSDDPHSTYVGYDLLDAAVRVVARRQVGDHWEFLLEPTPFYAEGGGQVADQGWLLGPGGPVLDVFDVRKKDGYHVHRGRLRDGNVFPEEEVVAQVDGEARRSTERNHTATHLLHAALKRVVGEHVTQAGSLVAPTRLRFDFHHFTALTPAQVRAIEDDVNRAILEDHAVHKQVTSMDDARKAGAVAMFGEKYGTEVRQVFVTGGEGDVSRELCGGCHVRRTGEIGFFRIVSQESVAAGIRRVEAVTGWNALRHFRDEDEVLGRVEGLVRAGSLSDVETRVQGMLEENDQLKKEVARLRSAMLSGSTGDLLDGVEQVNGVSFLAAEFPVSDVGALREAADRLRDRMQSGVGLLAARAGEKAALLVFITDDLVESRNLRADAFVKEVAKIVGGGGGGRPQLATAGGKEPARIPEALRHGRAVLEKMLSES
jgi:alanyl-tRNA synthetase